MELNVVSQIDYTLDKKNRERFDQILEKSVEILNIDKLYTLSIIFVNDAIIHEINRDYRNIDRPTDVISFALLDSEDTFQKGEEDNELGDIFINIDAVTRQAEEYKHSFDRELSFLFTHGLLHLLGYDHMNEEEEKIMFARQDEILDEIIKK